jgi:hypothetical protein
MLAQTLDSDGGNYHEMDFVLTDDPKARSTLYEGRY